jgi:deazaflavin-dependent oxidoreductase (nitroreductase family)
MAPNRPFFASPAPRRRFSIARSDFWSGSASRPHMQLLQVRGRKTGRVYSSPVNLLQVGGKKYLVAPRGQTQWVRNAESAGEVVLKRGSARNKYRLVPIPDSEKPEILKSYLDSYKSEVQRYFPVPAGSPPAAFRDIASHYPVFELVPS